MKTYKKVLIGIPTAALALYLLSNLIIKMQDGLLAREARVDVGFDLMLKFKSPRVPTINTNTLAQLHAIHLRAPHVRIRNKDAPPPIGDGTATYHILYTITTNWDTRAEQPLLGLRIKIQGTNHTILSHWIPTPPAT